MTTTNNNNSTANYGSYTNSPGSASSASSGSSTSSVSSPSNGAYLVDISANSGYSYLGQSSQHLPVAHHQQLQQQLHQQQLQQQHHAWYSDQALMNGHHPALVDGYLNAAAAAHQTLYAPNTTTSSQIHQQQQAGSVASANQQPAHTPASSNVANGAATRGKNKRKNVGVDKKVYQATMKPIIERQRRARINSSLEELHALLRCLTGNNIRARPANSPDGACSDPAQASSNQRRIEKADILEQAVRFIKNLKSGGSLPSPSASCSSANSSSASSSSTSNRPPSPNSQQPSGLHLAAIQQAFCAGYAECTRLTTNWLASQGADLEKISAAVSSSSSSNSHDDSHLSGNTGIEDHDSDSMAEDEDAYLGGSDEDHEDHEGGSSSGKTGNPAGRQLREQLEDHLINRLNERLTAHLSKCLPPASSVPGGRLPGQPIPTPPQSPKDLLLPFLTANGAMVAGGPSAANYQLQQHQQNSIPQQFSPISPYTAQQMSQQQQQHTGAQSSHASNTQQQPTTVIYYDPTQQQDSSGQTPQQQQHGANSSQLSPLMTEFMATETKPEPTVNALMFNNFVAQLQQSQRAAAAAGLYGCWRPWDS